MEERRGGKRRRREREGETRAISLARTTNPKDKGMRKIRVM